MHCTYISLRSTLMPVNFASGVVTEVVPVRLSHAKLSITVVVARPVSCAVGCGLLANNQLAACVNVSCFADILLGLAIAITLEHSGGAGPLVGVSAAVGCSGLPEAGP